MTHTDQVERYAGTLSQLADDVGNLRYDALASFLLALAAKLESDGIADKERGRPKLAATLCNSAGALKEAGAEMERAWTICAPHM